MGISIRRNITKKRNSSCSMPGVWRAVAYSKGAAVIFHGPKACAHVTHSMDIGSCYRAQARNEALTQDIVPLVSSLLTEQHSIFGGEEQLAKCIDYVVCTYQPQYIVIANSCVAGVIGDDVQSVASAAEAKYRLPILTIPCSGFLDGEYYIGYFQTALALVDRFMIKPQPFKANTAVLLGDQGGLNSGYVQEVINLLSFFGIKVIGQFPSYTSYDDMNKIPSAALIIILGGSGQSDQYLLKLAKHIKAKFGIPYLGDVYPIGWNSTRQWLHNLGVMLQQEQIAQKIIEQEAARLFSVMENARKKTQGKKVVLCIGRLTGYFRPQWLIDILMRLEVKIIGAILLEGYREKDQAAMIKELNACINVGIYQEQDADLLVKQADFILTTHEISSIKLRQLFLPLMPTAGATGEIQFIEKMIKLLCRSSNRGGIVYG